jgi:hypothetical protein
MFGDENIQSAGSHQALANAFYRNQDFKKALASQELAHR